MKIVYVSTVVSNQKMKKIIQESKNKPLQSIQKFHRLLCIGFVKNNIEIKTISVIPMSRRISDKILWKEKKEIEEGVEYNYIPFINVKILRQVCVFLGTILKVIAEIIRGKKEKVFICDILNTTITYTTLLLSKIFRFKCIAIVTDLPQDMGDNESINKKINRKLQNRFDGYVILTEAMNEKINQKNRPYIVIEGIADDKMKNLENNIENKYSKKVCIYAGGLYEKYGVKCLIDAFIDLNRDDAELHLYGAGELEEYIKKMQNEKIKFFGVVENEKIVDEELKATLLINPRFSNEEYTKYSFPSKNMEYMASGTPILTTKLPGIPEEYYPYIYTFEEESIEGFKEKLEKILKEDTITLFNKGKKAKQFVMTKKNNIIQAEKIIQLTNDKIL